MLLVLIDIDIFINQTIEHENLYICICIYILESSMFTKIADPLKLSSCGILMLATRHS